MADEMDIQQRIEDKLRERRQSQRKKSKIPSSKDVENIPISNQAPFRSGTDRRKDRK